MNCGCTLQSSWIKRGEIRVVGIRKQQRAIRKSAAKRDGKQQIVIVNATVEVAIEIRKVFDQFNPALLKHFQIEIGLDALNLTAEIERVVAADHRVSVAKLKPPLLGLLRHAKRRAVLNARKSKLRSGRHRHRLVDEVAETEVETVDIARRDKTRVVRQETSVSCSRSTVVCEAEPMERTSVLAAIPFSR